MSLRMGHVLWRLGSGLWLGTIFFFFVGIAPTAFREVPMPAAARFIDQVFPIYYAVGLWGGGAAMVGAILAAWFSGSRPGWAIAAGGAISWGLVIYARGLLAEMVPINPQSGQFAALHHQSVVVNTVIMLLLAACVAWEAWVYPG
ncbi:MAG: DUF4149 domain-containing protein [Thermaerobacter sp.]|nr:DUF4149 domain-containing protein [Thermaerobacter sp.]